MDTSGRISPVSIFILNTYLTLIKNDKRMKAMPVSKQMGDSLTVAITMRIMPVVMG